MSRRLRVALGVLLVILLPLMVAGVVTDPMRVDQENFRATWSSSVAAREAYPTARALFLLFAGSAVAAAVLTWRMFTAAGASAARFSAIGLGLSGALATAAVAFGTRLDELAIAWLERPGDLQIEAAARATEPLRTYALAGAFLASLVTLVVVGISAQRHTSLPRWLYALPVLASTLVVASPIGFAGVTETGGGGMLILAAFILLAWLIVVAVSIVFSAGSRLAG